MYKRVTPQGIIKAPSAQDKKPTRDVKNIPKREESTNFEINRNEFPSLNEIYDKAGHHGKNSMEFHKPFSYSEKLKKASTESRSSLKVEAASGIPKSSPTFVDCSSAKDVTSCNRSSYQAFSAMNKIKLPDKNNSLSNSERSMTSAPDETSARASNRGRSLKVENETSESHQKTNYQMNRNAKSAMPNRTLTSQSISNRTDSKIVNNSQKVEPSNNQKQLEGRSSNSQHRISGNVSASKHQSNNKSVPQQTDMRPSEVKKKKRKSKVKRQAALQSGKILVLTPEAHSKFFNQSNATSFKQNNNVANINDSEEYPELGAYALPKSNKENNAKHIEITTKDALVAPNKNEVDNAKLQSNPVDPQPTVPKKTEVLNVDVNTNAKSSDNEKAAVPVKDPLTVSLFDMLLTAKPRKKEAEKKNELAIHDSSLSTVKPLPKVLGKKGISSAVNPLDSSCPAVKRGKEREKPKTKKPSRMKKLILKGRQLRKLEMYASTDGENENTDGTHDKISDDELLTSKSIDPIEVAMNHDSTLHTDNELLSDNDYFDNKVFSEDSIKTPSNEDNQSLPTEQNNGLSSDCHSSDSEVLITESHEIKTSESLSAKALLNLRENKENLKPLDQESSHECSHKPCLSHEQFVNSVKKGEDCICYREYGVLNNISMSVEAEYPDFDISVRNNISDEKKSTSNFESSLESTSPSLSMKNIDGCSNVLEESSSNRSLNTVENGNESIIVNTDASGLDTNFLNSKLPMSSSHNENMLSSSSFINSEDSQKKDGNSLDCPSGLSHLSEPEQNAICHSEIFVEEKSEAVKTMIHSHKFRKYCNHFISKEIDESVFKLLDDLARFQDRMHQKDPVKARVRKRLLYGIKEIKRHMTLKKLKGIILATDIEDIKAEGGLNDVVAEIMSLAEAYHIPYIFSHRRFNLGKVCRKGVPVSCVGILNYEGSELNFKRILELQKGSKLDYSKVIQALDTELSNNQIKTIIKLGKGSHEKLHEVRTTILKEHFKPNTNLNEDQLHVTEISTSNDVDSNHSNVSVCEIQTLLAETNITTPKEIDKSEICRILTKYNII